MDGGGGDVAGWNAFDEPTREWLRKRLAEPQLRDCFGDAITVAAVAPDLVQALRGAAQRDLLLARRVGRPIDEVRAQLKALAAQGLVTCDAGGFWEIA